MTNKPKTETNDSEILPPTDESFENRQLSLFQGFLCNTNEQRDKLSNTIELWDAIPKYSTTPQAMNKARTKEGLLLPLTKAFRYRGVDCEVYLTPAIIKRTDKNKRFFDNAGDENREFKAFFPSAISEVIEDCLRKLTAEKNAGFFDADQQLGLGACFTLYELHKELKARKHTLSYTEIAHHLAVMAGSNIKISTSDNVTEETENYISLGRKSASGNPEDPKALYFVRFHSLVTRSVKEMTYRQYNYQRMLKHRSQLARWLHKKLAHEYLNASITTPYKLRFSTVKRDSHLLNSKRMNDNATQLEAALDELKRDGELSMWKKSVTSKGRKIEDIEYLLVPSHDFSTEQIRANKRLGDQRFDGGKLTLR